VKSVEYEIALKGLGGLGRAARQGTGRSAERSEHPANVLPDQFEIPNDQERRGSGKGLNAVTTRLGRWEKISRKAKGEKVKKSKTNGRSDLSNYRRARPIQVNL